MDDRFKGYHLCETYLMQPSILPEDYFAYVFSECRARVFVSLRSHVCVPRAPSIIVCAGLMRLGRMMRWQGGSSICTVSWLSFVYRALEEHQSLLGVEPSMLPCLLGGRFHGLLGWQFRSQTIRQVQPPQARGLSRSRVSVCQWESRWLLVEDGSNGMWRCGSGVLTSPRRKGVRKDAYAQFLISTFCHALVHTIPWILELHQSIKQACSEHAYRGGEAAWPAYCFLPGTG
jgi:hypothetical protein